MDIIYMDIYEYIFIYISILLYTIICIYIACTYLYVCIYVCVLGRIGYNHRSGCVGVSITCVRVHGRACVISFRGFVHPFDPMSVR